MIYKISLAFLILFALSFVGIFSLGKFLYLFLFLAIALVVMQGMFGKKIVAV